MKLKQLIFLTAFLTLLSGCDVAKQLGGAYNMTQCKYDYKSITNLTVSGMNLSSGLNAANLLKLTTLLTGNTSSIPLDMTLNLNVTNPNQTEAFLNGLQYILSVDNIQFTTGSLTNTLNIASGGTQTLPLNIGFDLATLLRGETKNTAVNIVKNFLGVGSEKSSVTLQLKPTFLVGNVPVTSPVYIPVTFSFGESK